MATTDASRKQLKLKFMLHKNHGHKCAVTHASAKHITVYSHINYPWFNDLSNRRELFLIVLCFRDSLTHFSVRSLFMLSNAVQWTRRNFYDYLYMFVDLWRRALNRKMMYASKRIKVKRISWKCSLMYDLFIRLARCGGRIEKVDIKRGYRRHHSCARLSLESYAQHFSRWPEHRVNAGRNVIRLHWRHFSHKYEHQQQQKVRRRQGRSTWSSTAVARGTMLDISSKVIISPHFASLQFQ